MNRERGPAYWDEVIASRSAARASTLWRAHADRVNRDLCRAWWPEPRPARVLKTDLFDEASGAGLWPSLVEGSAWACGIDLSPATVLSARVRYPSAHGGAADVRRLPFRDAAFDLIISNSTLDHFRRRDDIATSLAELGRVLRPGGRLILTLDNPMNPVVALRNALPFGWLNRLGLVPYFVGATAGPREGGELLSSLGFRVMEVRAVMHVPRAPGVALSALGDRAGAPAIHKALLASMGALEVCGRWPTRFLTGYFVAFLAEKR